MKTKINHLLGAPAAEPSTTSAPGRARLKGFWSLSPEPAKLPLCPDSSSLAISSCYHSQTRSQEHPKRKQTCPFLATDQSLPENRRNEVGFAWLERDCFHSAPPADTRANPVSRARNRF